MKNSRSSDFESRKDDPLQIACVGALAFMAASVAHEVIGHGGVAFLTGGHITLISSVYFRAEHVGPSTDAAGPLANLVLGGLLWAVPRSQRPKSSQALLMFVATMAFNLFWGAGVFVYSGMSGKGDWAFLFRDAGPAAIWTWRAGLVAVGLLCYRFATVAASHALSQFAETQRAPRPLSRVGGCLYVSAGATCCLAALLYRGPVGPALKESVLETFVSFVGLLIIARRDLGKTERDREAGTRTLPRNRGWILGAMIAFAVYAAVLGRGYFN